MTRGVSVSVAVAAADRFSAEAREAFARDLGAEAASAQRAALVTCHRVEVYEVDRAEFGAVGTAAFDAGPIDGGASVAPVARPSDPLPTQLVGDDAVRHLFRLAVGLESAILGEDQVLHQLREALADLREKHADPRLIRLFELAVGAGRRVRAEHPAADRNLGELAVRWIERRTGPLEGRPVLVAGAGRMGRLAVSALARRRAVITVASRSRERAEGLAAGVRATATDLGRAAADAANTTGAIVALAGPWPTFLPASVLPVVDLSFPLAVPTQTRTALGDAFADVDRIFRDAASLTSDAGSAADFRASANAIVEEAVAAYGRWLAGRESVSTLRALRERSESHRDAELRRLLRRLPDLDAHERDLIEAFSERLVAGILHEPSAALRDDVDGRAAAAATRLFGL